MDKFLNSSRKRDCPEVISNIEKKQKIRKYDDSYLNFGFTSTVVANVEHPQCVVCLKVMAVESMLPNKMKRHLNGFFGLSSYQKRKTKYRKGNENRTIKIYPTI